MTKTVVAGALGDCTHVAGVYSFLRLAEAAGWRTVCVGPAVGISDFLSAARREKKHVKRSEALLVAVSYRLAPEAGGRLLTQFANEAADLQASGVHFVFGGTPAVAEQARGLAIFEKVFDGSESAEQALAYLKGQPAGGAVEADYPQTLVERIQWRAPYPVLRHNFGLPGVEATAEGIQQIAAAEALDVISIWSDQDAQENFFHPERQNALHVEAEGVPVRRASDLRRLYEASRCGDFPLMQACSGTDDFTRYAQLLSTTIHNAWCSIPLFWCNRMDSRGPWGLQASVKEHLNAMAWHGQRNLPVEVDEPHQWTMRDAPDVIFVAAGFLSAYNAKKCGVKDYVASLEFNSPPGISDAMDLARMDALLRLIEPLAASDFRIWRQTRLGLLSRPQDPDAARGHLASAIYLQMAVRPHICHLVAQAEVRHSTTVQDIVETSKIARSAIRSGLGAPDMRRAPEIQQRAQHLMSEAVYTLEAMRDLAAPGTADPWTDPATLARAVTGGMLDAPQLSGNPIARGRIRTRILNGGCDAVDRSGKPITEKQRLSPLL